MVGPSCDVIAKEERCTITSVLFSKRRSKRGTVREMSKGLCTRALCESRTDGFGSHCERHAELLNRIVSVGTDSDCRRYVRIEPDIRHAELVLRNLGLEGSKTKPLTTPGFKVDEKELALREKEVPLDSQDATRYRSCVMRLSYLALDREDMGEPVKCLARSMAKPNPGSLRDLKKVAR